MREYWRATFLQTLDVMKLSYPLEILFIRAAGDARLLPSHISLFTAIYHYSLKNDPKKPFKVCRRELMQCCRIKSKATYHKCISELVIYKYISYKPSYDPFRASEMSLKLENPLIT